MKINEVIHQAVCRETELGKFLLLNYSIKLKEFEKKYRIKTLAFVKLFEEGKTEDEQDYFEWYSLFEGKKHWEEKLAKLQKV